MFFNFRVLLLKISQTFLRLRHFFLFSGYPINSILVHFNTRVVHIYKILAFDEAFFPPNYQSAYDYQTFQGGDMLRGALTHRYAWHLNGVVMLVM